GRGQPQHGAKGLPGPGARRPGGGAGRPGDVRAAPARRAAADHALAARPVARALGPRSTRGRPRRRGDRVAAEGHAAVGRPGGFRFHGGHRMSGPERRFNAVTGTDGPDSAEPIGAAAIETTALTKRYRRATALSDCTITVPQGRI